MDGILRVQISDMLEGAPAPVQEALAVILLGKLYRKQPDCEGSRCLPQISKPRGCPADAAPGKTGTGAQTLS